MWCSSPNEINNANPKGEPLISICIGTFRKQDILDEVLKSIREKNNLCPYPYEVIVADDCPKASSMEVVRDNGAYYIWNANCQHKNPSIPRHCTLRLSRGKIIIQMSDDCVLQTDHTVEKFVELTKDDNAVFATVLNVDPNTQKYIEDYTSKNRQKPYFFCGSIFRSNLEKVGFQDLDYIFPAYDDDSLSVMLKKNKIRFEFTDEILVYHQNHLKGSMANGIDSAAWYYSRNIK